MLCCVYHLLGDMQVVESDERDSLVASGFWFNSPLDATNARLKVEDEIKDEVKPESKPKLGRPKKESKDE